MRPHRILVTDGDERSSLAVVRSLKRAGHAVYVCSPKRRCLAGASRHATAQSLVPDPHEDPGEYADAVARLIGKWEIEIILPVTEASLLSLLPERARLGDVLVPFPDGAVFRRISDRAQVFQEAMELGIAVPGQKTLRSREEAAGVDGGAFRFPVVLKPSPSTGRVEGRLVKFRVLYAADEMELHSCLRRLPAESYPVHVQERVIGPGVGVFLLVWGGRTVAVFSHRRIREKPPSGGVSVCCEGIPADAALVAQSRALLDSFGWNGVAMVEWKLDRARGIPFLMEVNARFWGSLQLAIDSGVDFPALLVAAATGGRLPESIRARVGRRSRWWWGDVDHVLIRLRKTPEELNLPPDAPTRWQTLREVLWPWRARQRDAVFCWGDPWPFVRETIGWFATAVARSRAARRVTSQNIAWGAQEVA